MKYKPYLLFSINSAPRLANVSAINLFKSPSALAKPDKSIIYLSNEIFLLSKSRDIITSGASIPPAALDKFKPTRSSLLDTGAATGSPSIPYKVTL